MMWQDWMTRRLGERPDTEIVPDESKGAERVAHTDAFPPQARCDCGSLFKSDNKTLG